VIDRQDPGLKRLPGGSGTDGDEAIALGDNSRTGGPFVRDSVAPTAPTVRLVVGSQCREFSLHRWRYLGQRHELAMQMHERRPTRGADVFEEQGVPEFIPLGREVQARGVSVQDTPPLRGGDVANATHMFTRFDDHFV
jgi:hypothetical protein